MRRLITAGVIQPQLRTSDHSHPYEQEADRLAEQVMRTSLNEEDVLSVSSLNEEKVSRKCHSCQDEEERKIKISRKLSSPTTDINGFDMSQDTVKDIDSMRGRGSPLDSSTLEVMGSRFGFDFSNVRVHTDESAARSANTLNARAYTIDNNIMFGEGQYAPSTTQGRKLLAHELTHVIQNSSETDVRMDNIYRQDDGGVSAGGGAAGTPPTVDCNTAKISQISSALPIAIAMVNKAISVLGTTITTEVSALMIKYFRDSNVSTQLHALEGYNSLLNGITSSFNLECEEPGSFLFDFVCGGTYAYVWGVPWTNVHLCPGAFGRSATDLAETITHESSHKFSGTDDKAYCWGGCPSSLSRWDAYDNADSYSKFAWEVYTTLP